MSDQKLKGRRILVTGAASGMGRSIAELFSKQGAQLALLDRNASAVAELASELQAFSAGCDVADASQTQAAVQSAIEACAGLDGVVHAAGVYLMKPIDEIDPESFSRIMSVNVNGAYHVARAAIPALRRSEAATLVNIASISAYVPMAGTSVYSASKAAVIMFTKCLALELGPTIRANTICPGVIRTEMTRHIWSDPAGAAKIANRAALKKIGMPEDIARAALFLSCEDSSFSTGTEIVVDGGSSWR